MAKRKDETSKAIVAKDEKARPTKTPVASRPSKKMVDGDVPCLVL